MTILDTNVLSELMKRSPEPDVVSWVNNQMPSSLFITSITQAEILYGLELLQNGQRKTRLRKTAEEMFAGDFNGRIPDPAFVNHPFAVIAASGILSAW